MSCGTINPNARTLGRVFARHVWEVVEVNGHQRNRCTRCKYLNPVRVPLEVRFWDHVQKAPGDLCWPWTGAIDKAGYGRYGHKGTSIPANRMAWILTNGDPGKLFVCHRCDNPRACDRITNS